MVNLFLLIILSVVIFYLGLNIYKRLSEDAVKDCIEIDNFRLINIFFLGQFIFFNLYLIISFYKINFFLSYFFITIIFVINYFFSKHKLKFKIKLKINKKYFFLLIVLLILFILTLAPPSDYDSINYHLTLPKYHIEVEKFTFRESIVYDFFPPFHSSIIIFFHSLNLQTGYQSYNFILICLIILCFLEAKKIFFLSDNSFLICVLIFLFSKITLLSLTNNSQDLLLMCSIIIFTINYFSLRRDFKFENQIFFIISALTTIYTKHHGLIYAFIIFCFLFYDCLKKNNLRIFIKISLIVLAIYAPYLIKNLIISGDLFVSTQYIKTYNSDLLLSLTSIPYKFFNIFIFSPDKLLASPFVMLFFFYGIFIPNKNYKTLYLICLFYFFVWIFIFHYQIRYFLYILPILIIISANNFDLIIRSGKKMKYFSIFILTLSLLFLLINANSIFFRKIPIIFNQITLNKYYSLWDHEDLLFKECELINSQIKKDESYVIFGKNSFFCKQKNNLRNIINNQNVFLPKKITSYSVDFQNYSTNYFRNKKLRFILLKKDYKWSKYKLYENIMNYIEEHKTKKYFFKNHLLIEIL